VAKSGPAEFPRCFWIYRLVPGPPHFPTHGRLLVHFGGCKLVLDQVIGQTELLISLILRWVTNKDLPVSRVRVDVVVFPTAVQIAQRAPSIRGKLIYPDRPPLLYLWAKSGMQRPI
jgi:hypothetical protein